MRVVIINKSDGRGGAAVVSRRLMHALRSAGVDASMLVVEKLSNDEHVHLAASKIRAKIPFIAERLDIYLRNGRNREDLFKVDTGRYGLPLAEHPLVKSADVVCLGWVNQGMLSLREIRKIAADKPVVWTMHDLWCATGICHHPGECDGFKGECGVCPLIHGLSGPEDMSHEVWSRKRALYDVADISFVAVSHWLEGRCRESALMRESDITVIGNPFALPKEMPARREYEKDGRIELLIAAARVDDPIKGLPILREALRQLAEADKKLAGRLRLTVAGELRDAEALENMPIKVRRAGSVSQADMPRYYADADLLLSPSLYETLPGTLVEAQVYGAVPVASDSGGQRDIVSDGETGILVDYSGKSISERGRSFAHGIERGIALAAKGIQTEMFASVRERFSAEVIAARYIALFERRLRIAPKSPGI